jgi:hypothetical protein
MLPFVEFDPDRTAARRAHAAATGAVSQWNHFGGGH